ncbi:hypothetical protein F4680DRAFT_429319 [Xylaria scruposa]|nr:hypothetical protein F4680DRAFT_429319 [Xylaria scruposa]
MSLMSMIPKVFDFRVSEPENSSRLGSWNYDRKKAHSARRLLSSLEILSWVHLLLGMIALTILLIEWVLSLTTAYISSQTLACFYSIVLIGVIDTLLHFDDAACRFRCGGDNPFQDRRVSVTTHVHLVLGLAICCITVYGLPMLSAYRWAVFVLLVLHIADSCACVIWTNVLSNDHASGMLDRILSATNDENDDDHVPGLINESWLSQCGNQETTPLLSTDSSVVHESNNNWTYNAREARILRAENGLRSELAEDTSHDQEFPARIHPSIWYLNPDTGYLSVFKAGGALACILSVPQLVCNILIMYDHPAIASKLSFKISSILTSFGGFAWVGSYCIIISLRVPLNKQFAGRFTILDGLAIQTVVLAIVILVMSALRISVSLPTIDALVAVPCVCSGASGLFLLIMGFGPLSKNGHQIIQRYSIFRTLRERGRWH